MTQVQALVAASRGEVPRCCADCVFWQRCDTVTDPAAKAGWVSTVEDEFGAWGRLVDESPGARGLIQYGPAHLFPRAWELPAGPPDRAAVLITCAYVHSDEPAGVLERLLLEALADVQGRGFAQVDAFALESEDPNHAVDTAHHTLFDAGILSRLGFVSVRSVGRVHLMRLVLDGAIPVEQAGRWARLVRRFRPAPAVRPEPA